MIKQLLDERQVKDVEFSRVYTNQFRHGAANHNSMVIIATLADYIDMQQAALVNPEFHQQLAKAAFEAYRAAKGGIAFEGSAIPGWDNVAPGVQGAWEVAVKVVLSLIP